MFVRDKRKNTREPLQLEKLEKKLSFFVKKEPKLNVKIDDIIGNVVRGIYSDIDKQELMTFTIETSALRRLARLANRKMPDRRRRDAVLRIGASGAYAYAEANATVAAAEALVIEEGECTTE